MKKFFAIIILLLQIPLFIALVFTINLKFALFNPVKLKAMITESNLPVIVTSYVQDKIIKDNNLKLDEGQTLEDLNTGINKEEIAKSLTGTIDKFFSGIADPNNKNIDFSISLPAQIGDQNMSYEKKLDFSNPTYRLLGQINIFILALLIASLIGLLIFVLLISDKAKGRFQALGIYLIIGAVLTLLLNMTLNYLLPDLVTALMKASNFIKDPVLITGVQKAVENIFKDQKLWYYIESAGLLISGLVVLWLSNYFNKEDLKDIDKLAPQRPPEQKQAPQPAPQPAPAPTPKPATSVEKTKTTVPPPQAPS